MDDLQKGYENLKRVQAVSKEIESSLVTIKSRQDKSFDSFKAVDLEKWLNGDKPKKEYKYFTFRSNNPYIFFYSKDNICFQQDKVYLTAELPDKEVVGKEYYEGIDENDSITIHYSNNWWEKCSNWEAVKAKKNGNKQN